MNKAVLVIDMPSCCDECFALDNRGDYPMCRITQEQRGYTFRIRECRMDKCPLQPLPQKSFTGKSDYYECGWEDGWNTCIAFLSDTIDEAEE